MKKISKKSAFSLVELSVVILVIGIVLAGITQSSRLIRQFQLSNARTKTETSPVPSIPDLVVWLDATSEISTKDSSGVSALEDGDLVSTWSTIQTISSQITFTASGGDPAFAEEGINDLPAILFDKTNIDQRMTADFAGFDYEFTVFVVAKKVSNNALGAELVNIYNASQDVSLFFAIQPDGDLDASLYNAGFTGRVISDAAIENDQAFMASYFFNPRSGDARSFINQTRQDSATDTSASTQTVTSLTLNLGNHGVTNDRVFDGYIGEAIIYNRGLKSEERVAVETYLMDKWNI